MAAAPPELAQAGRILLVVPDGADFPAVTMALRMAGFRGESRVITNRGWGAVVQGKCERCLFLPAAGGDRSGLLTLLRLVRGQQRWADAILWLDPPRGRRSGLLRRLLVRKPIYCFYDGELSRFDPGRQPGTPGTPQVSARERELALRYLLPALSGQPAAGSIRVAVDADGIHLREATGVQWYRRHLFAALCEPEAGVDLVGISAAAEARCVWELPWTNRLRRIPPALAGYQPAGREQAVPLEAVTGPVDLFHLTFFERPAFTCPRVVTTVYDIMPLVIPEYFPRRFVDRLRAIEPFWKSECDRLICISESTRNDLEERMGIPKSRTVCIPPGRHPHFHPRGQEEIEQVHARYGVRAPYVLALGSIAPHKNLQGLCRAFALAKQQAKLPHQLVIVGRPAWLMHEVLEQIEQSGLAADVVFTGYADWVDLPALYSGAEAFCMPSLYEGYGLPVQEAMCCGCPVLLSDCTSLPEVAGDAGIYWDPRDVEDMAAKLSGLLGDKAQGERMRAAVLAHAETFPTWREVAMAYRAVYEAVLAGN